MRSQGRIQDFGKGGGGVLLSTKTKTHLCDIPIVFKFWGTTKERVLTPKTPTPGVAPGSWVTGTKTWCIHVHVHDVSFPICEVWGSLKWGQVLTPGDPPPHTHPAVGSPLFTNTAYVDPVKYTTTTKVLMYVSIYSYKMWQQIISLSFESFQNSLAHILPETVFPLGNTNETNDMKLTCPTRTKCESGVCVGSVGIRA